MAMEIQFAEGFQVMQLLLIKDGTCKNDIIIMAEFLYQVLSMFITGVSDYKEF